MVFASESRTNAGLDNIAKLCKMTDYFLVSCEHGGNRIPLPYKALFQNARYRLLLDSHRGYDPGALLLAREMAKSLQAPLLASTVSRLLIDLNRSVGHPHSFSKATREAPAEVRLKIVDDHYLPYRTKAMHLFRQAVADGRRVVHISCHSFTPELDGQVRNADIGLLYDPARSGELDLCGRWKASLKGCAPELKLRRNYPYLGKNDGFTAYLRQQFPAEAYLGIELEVNQKHIVKGGLRWPALRAKLIQSLRLALKM
jgi:predicted N-formylglutamate amidohydrolase